MFGLISFENIFFLYLKYLALVQYSSVCCECSSTVIASVHVCVCLYIYIYIYIYIRYIIHSHTYILYILKHIYIQYV